MTSTISKENRIKLQNYFIDQVISSGSRKVQDTVANIAKESELALATTHRGIAELVRRGVLTVQRSDSRRFPNIYTYTGELDETKNFVDKDAEIEYLRKKVKNLQREVKSLRERYNT